MPFSDAGSPREEGDLAALVQSLRLQLETIAEDSKAVYARVAAIEATAPEVTAKRLEALERSVAASMDENLERDTQQAEEMLGWDDSVSALEKRVELLEAGAAHTLAPALTLEVATRAPDGDVDDDDDDDEFAAFAERCQVHPAAEAKSVGATDAAEKQAAVLWVSTLKRLTDVELRVAATEVMARNQHVDLEAKVDIHSEKMDQIFGAQNDQLESLASVQATAERLAALEASVDASMAENLERDTQQAEEMLAWDESVSTLEVRVELLEVATPALEGGALRRVEDAPATDQHTAVLQRLTDVELRIAEVATGKQQHVEIEASVRVDLHSERMDEIADSVAEVKAALVENLARDAGLNEDLIAVTVAAETLELGVGSPPAVRSVQARVKALEKDGEPTAQPIEPEPEPEPEPEVVQPEPEPEPEIMPDPEPESAVMEPEPEPAVLQPEARAHPGDAALAALAQNPGAGKKKRQQKKQKPGSGGALVGPVKSSRALARELRGGMEAAGAAKAAKAARRAAVQAQQQKDGKGKGRTSDEAQP